MFLKHLRITNHKPDSLHDPDRHDLPSCRHRYLAADLPREGEWKPDKKRREGPRLRKLIGQPFSDPKYFWRPALSDWARTPIMQDHLQDQTTDLNPALFDAVKKRVAGISRPLIP